MFGHLDPPEEIEPGSSELTRVLGRANAIRRRRLRIFAAASCVVLVAALAGGFIAGDSGSSSMATTDYDFNLRSGPLPLGLAVPTTALIDVEFANPQDGFALAVHRNTVILASTTDGGSNWQVRNNRLPTIVGPQDEYPGQMEFIGSTGYLWGVPGDAGAPLWVSHDGGSSWARAPIGPYVYDVSAIGANVWALTGTCPSAGDGVCSLSMEASLTAGASWGDLGPLDAALGATADGVAQPVELARITTTRAYVLTDAPAANPYQLTWQLAFTSDAGVSWSERGVPCTSLFDAGAEVAASGTADLWLVCGGTAAGGAQIKELYRSSDGGLSWTLTSTTNGQVWPMTTAPADPLPGGGYVAPLESGHRNLAVASPTTAWLYPERGDLYKTIDGGLNWVAVPELAAASFASGGQGNVTFLSPTQGWICAYGVGLWQTVDGTHWHSLGQS